MGESRNYKTVIFKEKNRQTRICAWDSGTDLEGWVSRFQEVLVFNIKCSRIKANWSAFGISLRWTIACAYPKLYLT